MSDEKDYRKMFEKINERDAKQLKTEKASRAMFKSRIKGMMKEYDITLKEAIEWDMSGMDALLDHSSPKDVDLYLFWNNVGFEFANKIMNELFGDRKNGNEEDFDEF